MSAQPRSQQYQYQSSQTETTQPSGTTPTSTQVESQPPLQSQAPSAAQAQGAPVLRLRGSHARDGRSVRWAQDVVNNEGLGRKKSKVCCIYHRPRDVGESSDDSSSDSSSASDSDTGHGNGNDDVRKHTHSCRDHKKRRRGRPDGDEDAGPSHDRKPSPNAYERMPKPVHKESTEAVHNSQPLGGA